MRLKKPKRFPKPTPRLTAFREKESPLKKSREQGKKQTLKSERGEEKKEKDHQPTSFFSVPPMIV